MIYQLMMLDLFLMNTPQLAARVRRRNFTCISWMVNLCDTKTLSSHTCDTNHCSGEVSLARQPIADGFKHPDSLKLLL